MAKGDVNGPSAQPLWKFLQAAIDPGFPPIRDVSWNFGKFLVDRRGVPVARFAPTSSPLALERDIQRLLAERA